MGGWSTVAQNRLQHQLVKAGGLWWPLDPGEKGIYWTTILQWNLGFSGDAECVQIVQDFFSACASELPTMVYSKVTSGMFLLTETQLGLERYPAASAKTGGAGVWQLKWTSCYSCDVERWAKYKWGGTYHMERDLSNAAHVKSNIWATAIPLWAQISWRTDEDSVEGKTERGRSILSMRSITRSMFAEQVFNSMSFPAGRSFHPSFKACVRDRLRSHISIFLVAAAVSSLRPWNIKLQMVLSSLSKLLSAH